MDLKSVSAIANVIIFVALVLFLGSNLVRLGLFFWAQWGT
jgi:hypothetical protein